MTEQRESFFERLYDLEEAFRTHPYAGWVTVKDRRTPKQCRELAGTAWEVMGTALRAAAEAHFDLGLADCRCRLMGLTARRLDEEDDDWRIIDE